MSDVNVDNVDAVNDGLLRKRKTFTPSINALKKYENPQNAIDEFTVPKKTIEDIYKQLQNVQGIFFFKFFNFGN